MAASEFWKGRTPQNRERLARLVRDWVDETVGRTVQTPEGRRNYLYPCTLREQACKDTVRHVETITLAYQGSSLNEWTEGFLDERLSDESLERCSFEDRLDLSFPSFIAALACQFLVQHAYTPVHRCLAAEHLVASLRIPMTQRVQILRRSGRNLAWTVDQALDSLIHAQDERAHRLVRRLCEHRPTSLRGVIALACQALAWEVAVVVRKHPEVEAIQLPDRLGEAEKPSAVTEPGDPLDELCAIACRVALDFPTEEGRSVLLWLMLGSISHKKVAPAPWNQGPGLVQPALIAALEQRWGPNWVQQQYRRPVGRLMAVHGAAAVLARLLARNLPEEALAEVRLPEEVGWNAFVLVGQETARQVVTGVLHQTGTIDPQFGNIRSPADLQTYLRRQHQEAGLTRQQMVSLASALCGGHGAAAVWTAFLQSKDVGLPCSPGEGAPGL